MEQDLTFESRPVKILEESERVLRNKTLKYVKILWSHQTEKEATWELESRMREQFPDLFTSGECSSFLNFQILDSLLVDQRLDSRSNPAKGGRM